MSKKRSRLESRSRAASTSIKVRLCITGGNKKSKNAQGKVLANRFLRKGEERDKRAIKSCQNGEATTHARGALPPPRPRGTTRGHLEGGAAALGRSAVPTCPRLWRCRWRRRCGRGHRGQGRGCRVEQHCAARPGDCGGRSRGGVGITHSGERRVLLCVCPTLPAFATAAAAGCC